MRLIVSSEEDKASQNILSKLLQRDWKEIDEWKENPVYKREEDHIVTVEKHHIYSDDVDSEVEDLLGLNFDEVVFISKHSSEAGVHSLTVHPIGNYGEAKFGGKEGKLVPASSQSMTAALLTLKEKAASEGIDEEYEISFEATHHGPYLETPTYYIEIGSDESSWKDENAGKVIADTVMSEEVKKAQSVEKKPVAICIGGGHYAPRFTELARNRKISLGHMVPNWGMQYLTNESFEEAVKKTPDVEYVYFDRSGTSGKEREKIESWAQDEGLEVVRSSDLEIR